MKTTGVLSLLFMVALSVIGCQGNNKNTEAFAEYQREMGSKDENAFDKMESSDVKAYYFHATRRCATCQAVEKVTKETITKNYEGKVSFESINREEGKDNPLIEKYKINGQTLIIVKGDEVINLTTEAFMNARSNPEKFEAKLKETIDAMF